MAQDSISGAVGSLAIPRPKHRHQKQSRAVRDCTPRLLPATVMPSARDSVCPHSSAAFSQTQSGSMQAQSEDYPGFRGYLRGKGRRIDSAIRVGDGFTGEAGADAKRRQVEHGILRLGVARSIIDNYGEPVESYQIMFRTCGALSPKSPSSVDRHRNWVTRWVGEARLKYLLAISTCCQRCASSSNLWHSPSLGAGQRQKQMIKDSAD